MLKRDIQGKFALKDNDYRQVHSLRLTDETWKALGIIAECFGMTRADYLSEVVRNNAHPRITRNHEPDRQAETQAFCNLTLYFLPDSTIFITPINALQKQILSNMKMPEALYQVDSVSSST